MPKIKMLRDMAVSRNGFEVERWRTGQIIDDCPEGLAQDLLDARTLGAVELTGDKKADAASEQAAAAEAAKREQEAKTAAALRAAAEKAALNAAIGADPAAAGS